MLPSCSSLRGDNLECLPHDVLNVIFGYLDVRSLLALCRASKALSDFIKNDILNKRSASLLVTNQLSLGIMNRSLNILSVVEKYKINFHWRKVFYNQLVTLKSCESFRPWLQLRSKDLFVSQGSKIYLFRRNKAGIVKKPQAVLKGHKEDVGRFVVKGDVIISGGNDGRICYWDMGKWRPAFSAKTRVRMNEQLYTDFCQSTVAVGFCLQGAVHFWSVKEDRSNFDFCKKIKFNELLRSVSLSEDAKLCALGFSGYKMSPLKILDMDSGHYLHLSSDFKHGAGIYDIVWESPQTLLTGGFDTILRLWDIRLGRCVKSWSDPFDATIYTLATDYTCTIMTGSDSHSRITLWDKRHSDWVQVYFVSRNRHAGAVYSFDFDPTYMFVALNNSLHVLNFSESDGTSRSLIP